MTRSPLATHERSVSPEVPARPIVVRVHPVGRRALLAEVAPGSAAVAAAAIRASTVAHSLEVVDLVPGASTVLIVLADPDARPAVADLLADLTPRGAPADDQQSEIELAVRYDGPDLPAVAERVDLPVQEVIRLHSAATYRAEFAGFSPGFVYLTGLPDVLHVPRHPSPRPEIPAGSLGIAAAYTAVYPRRTPAGWQLIGTYVDAPLWDPGREPPALIVAGMTVRFRDAGGR